MADQRNQESDSYRLLVSNIQDYAIYILDPAGIVVSWNNGAKRIKGYEAAEIIGRHFSVFYTPEDIEQNIPSRELDIAQNGHCETEGWRLRKNGSKFYAHISITPLYDEGGNFSGYAKVTRDITSDRKFDRRFQQIIDSAPSAMIMVNNTGTIEMVNTQAERLFGYLRSEMLGQAVEMLLPESLRNHHPSLRSHFFTNPHSKNMGKGRDLYAQRKDGTEIPVEIGLNPIETDDGIKVLSSILDISERKRMENRLRQVVDSSPNAMVMIGESGTIEMVNAQVKRVLGYDQNELVGQTVDSLVPDQFREEHPKMRASFFSNPVSRPMGRGRDLFARRKDGSEFPVEIGLNPIQTDEGIKVLSAIIDISDRKQKEQKIQAALEEKDILLGEIHHRVKNNLQIVYSLLDLQSFQIKDPKALEMLRDSQHRIQSMALIHQTLYQSNDFARVNFNQVLHSLIPSLLQSYVMNNCTVDYEISAEKVLVPLNQAIPCGLIINELVTNTLKHAFSGKTNGKISVKLSQEQDMINLSIEDDGIGLPEELNIDSSESLGMRLVTILTAQIKGNLDIHRGDPTRFTLKFQRENNIN